MPVRFPYVLLGVMALALLVYFPVINGEIIWVDDNHLLDGLRHSTDLNFSSLFVPGSSGGLYYRPVTIISYILNWKWLWQSAEWMRVINILIHASSAALCYGLLLRMTDKSNYRLSLIGAGLFLFHPLATESVCWISGRTDLLAGLFLLSSTWFLLSYRTTGASKHLVPALLLFFLAVLSKEFALAFVPGMLLIMYNKNLKATRKTVIRVAVYGAGIVGVFFLLRRLAFTTDARTIKSTLVIMNVDYWYTLKIFLQTTSFYLKKIVIPWPLNFSIDGIHFVYSLISWPLLLLLLVICSRFTLASALFSSCLFLLSPSLLIAFGQIAWTPYAERYAYISSAFLIMSVVVWLYERPGYGRSKLVLIVLTSMVLFFCVTTLQRSMEWSTSVTLAESTLKVNPDNRDITTLVGEAAIKDGNLGKAEIYLMRAEKLTDTYNTGNSGVYLADLYRYRGDMDAAMMKVEDVIQRSKCKSVEALEAKQLFLAQLVNRSAGAEKKEYLSEKLGGYKVLFKLTKAPRYLYLMGTHSAALGDINQARHYFVSAIKMMPKTDPLYQIIQQGLHSLPASGAGV